MGIVSFPWLKNVCVKSRKLMQYRNFETKIWMKSKVFPKYITVLIKCIGINFWSGEFWSYSFLTQEHCKLEILLGMFTFFKPSFWKSLQIVSCLIITLLEFHRNSLCICCIVVVISLGIGKAWAKDTNFDKANILKIIILPSRIRSKISSSSHSQNLFRHRFRGGGAQGARAPPLFFHRKNCAQAQNTKTQHKQNLSNRN